MTKQSCESSWHSGLTIVAAALTAAALATTAATAQTRTVFNSIPKTLPGNVASLGLEATSASEFGDGLVLDATTGTFGQATVILSSWACESGNWYQNNCETTPGATFSHPITINLYSVVDAYSPVYGTVKPKPDQLLGTITKSFAIPYRPSANPAKCPLTPGKWYSKKDNACFNGIATPIVLNFSSLHIAVPADGRVIASVAYNTSDYGSTPLRPQPCNSTAAGCPYDSLNVSADGSGPSGLPGGVGANIDLNGVYWNTSYAGFYCSPFAPAGVFQLDTDTGPCSWSQNHLQIEVRANTNAKHNPKGNAP